MDHEDVPTCTRVACALFAQGVYALRGWGELFEQRCSCFNCLTPELSRPASGEAACYKTSTQAEAAKRVRLERIVRQLPHKLPPGFTDVATHRPGCDEVAEL